MTEEELDYLASLKVRAHEEGLQEGLQEGLEKGLEKGLQQALEKVALDMLADNKPIEEIVKYSHLPVEKVLELQKK
ncbi:hypothetical protein [Fibrobacter sp. UWB12]|uniref:hypothetical protein n=1 Tax=Fibrobacter sp. UWB12 TaxID=1896203 RepID=UPI000933C82C|nr:hypothetical protein [Fibrobacter sp. UWB12]